MQETDWCRWDGERLILSLRVQPRSSKAGLEDVRDGRLRVRLNAPPVDGAANKALIELLAEAFGVPKSRVALLSGETGREKRVAIDAPRILPPPLPPR
ncbi:MAG: DUF167 domain-containing protein [Pseudomonadota bacterium]